MSPGYPGENDTIHTLPDIRNHNDDMYTVRDTLIL